MESDAKFAARLVLLPTHFVELRNRGLHLNGGHNSVLIVVGIILGAPKHREDRVPDVFVNRSVVSKENWHHNRKIIVQYLNHIICIHVARQVGEAANVRV